MTETDYSAWDLFVPTGEIALNVPASNETDQATVLASFSGFTQ